MGLGVVGEKTGPFLTSLQGVVVSAEVSAAVCQVGISLPQLRLLPARMTDAAAQEFLGALVLARVAIGHAQVEQREGMQRLLFQLLVQDAEIAFQLARLSVGR